MPAPRINDKQAELLVHHFGDRVMLVFAWLFFAVEYEGDPDLPSKSWLSIRGTSVLPTVQNACLIATLMAVRDIDDFFTPRDACHKMGRRTLASDLKASDLGFDANLNFLTAGERKRTNQELVHSTHHAAYGNPNEQWQIGKLVEKCTSQSLRFLSWAQSSLPAGKYEVSHAAAIFYSDRIREASTYVSKRLSKTKLN